MQKLFKRIFKNELILGSAYFFIGSFSANIFAFLFNFFVARKLSTLDYGIYASLMSLLTIVVLLPQSFSTTIVRFATEYFSKNDTVKAKKLYKQATIFLSVSGVIIFFGMIIFSSLIASFLHVSNLWLIISVGVLMFVSFISTINGSYLQSLLQFGFLSFSQALGAAVKLLMGIIFISLGFGIFGALGAFLISVIVTFLIAFTRLKFLFTFTKEKVNIPLWDMVKYAFPAMITSIALSSFISSDVILAKHFLTGQQAGLYAGLSLVGKVIFYFTGIIPSVMFPILINRYTKGHGVHSTFYLGLILVGTPSLILTVFYFLFPSFVIKFFLGGNHYLPVAGQIGFMALFLSLYSIISVMVNFFLSLKQTKVVFPVISMALLQVVLIFFFHATILQIILDSLTVSGSLIILLSIYYLYHQKIARTYVTSIPIPQEM